MVSTYPVYVLSLALCVVILATLTQASYEYSGLCTRLCSNGRGGNLCRCSAVHFAGKRTGTSYVVDTSSQQEARDLASPMDAYLLSKGDGRPLERETGRRWAVRDEDRSLLKQLLPHLHSLYNSDTKHDKYYQLDRSLSQRAPTQLQLANLLQGMGDEEGRLPTETAELDLANE